MLSTVLYWLGGVAWERAEEVAKELGNGVVLEVEKEASDA